MPDLYCSTGCSLLFVSSVHGLVCLGPTQCPAPDDGTAHMGWLIYDGHQHACPLQALMTEGIVCGLAGCALVVQNMAAHDAMTLPGKEP